MKPVPLAILACFALLTAACNGVVAGRGDLDPPDNTPDSGLGKPNPEPIEADAATQQAQCEQPILPPTLAAFQGEPDLFNGNGSQHIFAWETASGSGDYLVLSLDKAIRPRVSGNLQFDFTGEHASPCDQPADGVCLSLLVDWNPATGSQAGRYDLESGSLGLQANTPQPAAGSCRSNDGNLNACNDAGCSYYTCNDTCQSISPDNENAICAAGCSAWCPMDGELQSAVFADVSNGDCTSLVSLTF